MESFKKEIDLFLQEAGVTDAKQASVKQLYHAVSKAAMQRLQPNWNPQPGKKRACYFSAEFLVGRLIYSNLLNLDLLESLQNYLQEKGLEFSLFEQVEDDACLLYTSRCV